MMNDPHLNKISRRKFGFSSQIYKISSKSFLIQKSLHENIYISAKSGVDSARITKMEGRDSIYDGSFNIHLKWPKVEP